MVISDNSRLFGREKIKKVAKMERKHGKIEYKSLKASKKADKIEVKMNFAEKEWNKYKKLCEKLEKTNKDD